MLHTSDTKDGQWSKSILYPQKKEKYNMNFETEQAKPWGKRLDKAVSEYIVSLPINVNKT